jgi:hypothetical protein
MTNVLKRAILGAAAALSMTTASHAAVLVTYDSVAPAELQLVYDFDGLAAAGYELTLNGAAAIFDGALGLVPDIAAPPPGVTDNYLAIQQGGSAVFETPLLRKLSIYIGSPDSFNSIRFIGLDGFDETLSGTQLAAGAFNGDQSVGRYMTYDFGAHRVTKVIFGSNGNSFELDNIAVSAVPEPGAWALMIAGFGLLGTALRRRRAFAAA